MRHRNQRANDEAISHLKHTSNDELTSIDLPFRGGKLVMTLVSPKSTSLDEFTASLTPEKWTDITENQTAGEVNIMMPKFEFETTQNLKPALENMGLGSLFARPDLSGMTDDEPLRVSGVFQKTFIKVEEGGTEAAAATAIVVGATASVEPEPTIINMNQPFIFAIRDTERVTFCSLTGYGSKVSKSTFGRRTLNRNEAVLRHSNFERKITMYKISNHHQLRSLLYRCYLPMCVACGDGSSATPGRIGLSRRRIGHDENPSLRRNA